MVVEVVDQHQESVHVHVLVSGLLLRVCEFVYEGVGSVSPLALLCCCADQVGRGEVQEAPSSKNGELRHAYGDIRPSVCTSGISGGGLGAGQLVDSVEEVTLFTKNIEKPRLISQQLLHFPSRTSSFCSRPPETSGFLGGGRYQVASKLSSFSSYGFWGLDRWQKMWLFSNGGLSEQHSSIIR